MEKAPIPFGEIFVTATERSDGGGEICTSMSNHTFDHHIQGLAAKRGRSVGGVIIEALRLEMLFCESLDNPDKGLYVLDRGKPRRLLGI